MELGFYKPTHADAPTNDDLRALNGKIMGIKIREYATPKSDGTGMLSGNFVSEVHPVAGFEIAMGEKMEIVESYPASTGLDSALTRNAKGLPSNELQDDIPF